MSGPVLFGASTLPGDGEIVNVKSTQGDRVYEDCEVIGVGESRLGQALWVWISGDGAGLTGRVHAFVPVAEIEWWQSQ